MKLVIATFVLALLGSCERRYQPQASVEPEKEVPFFEVKEFEVDQCKYFMVYSYRHSMTAVEVEHKANCPNH